MLDKFSFDKIRLIVSISDLLFENITIGWLVDLINKQIKGTIDFVSDMFNVF